MAERLWSLHTKPDLFAFKLSFMVMSRSHDQAEMSNTALDLLKTLVA